MRILKNLMGKDLTQYVGTPMYAQAVLHLYCNYLTTIVFILIVSLGFSSWLSLNLFKSLKSQPVLIMSADGKYSELVKQNMYTVHDGMFEEFLTRITPVLFTPNTDIPVDEYLDKYSPYFSGLVLDYIRGEHENIAFQERTLGLKVRTEYVKDSLVVTKNGNMFDVSADLESFVSKGRHQSIEKRKAIINIVFVGSKKDNNLGLVAVGFKFIKEEGENAPK